MGDNRSKNKYERDSMGLFRLKLRFDKAQEMGAIGIHMKNIAMTKDVKKFLKEHIDVLDVKLNNSGEIVERECYYFRRK